MAVLIDQLDINRPLLTSICLSDQNSLLTGQLPTLGENHNTALPVFRDHSREVMKVVSYSRWSLNASSISLRSVVVSEQWSLKAGGLLIQVVSITGLAVLAFSPFPTMFYTFS